MIFLNDFIACFDFIIQRNLLITLSQDLGLRKITSLFLKNDHFVGYFSYKMSYFLMLYSDTLGAASVE